jgi:hypothetical protein
VVLSIGPAAHRRGVFRSIADLQAAINAYLADDPNRHASGCRWIDATCESARGRLVGDHPNTQPRSEAAQHSYVERANPRDADGDAALYEVDQRVQQQARKPYAL